MDKTVTGLLGAMAALAAGSAQAAPVQAAPAQPPAIDSLMQVSSYADLLKPIPNAVVLLGAVEAADERAALSEEGGPVLDVQYHDHDHHHHRRPPPRRRRPQHHHHHSSYTF